jgi:phage protein D
MSPTALLESFAPSIQVDGSVNEQFTRDLAFLRVTETTQGLYSCEMTLTNVGPTDAAADFLYFDRSLLDFGKRLEVTVRVGDRDMTLFAGKIMALEAEFAGSQPPTLTVLADDGLQDLRMTRRTRSFEDISDTQLFEQIARDHGLTPAVDVNGPTHKVLAQVNQSDLAFMRERALLLGAELWLDGDTLNVAVRTGRGNPEIPLDVQQNLISFRATADVANLRSSVTVSGWDVGNKEAIKETAEESAISAEAAAGRSGTSILKEAFGERKEVIAHSMPLNGTEAQAYAEAYFRMMARRFVVARGVVSEALDGFHVGAVIDVTGAGPFFNGKYALSEVEHTYDLQNGFRSHFTAERPFIME